MPVEALLSVEEYLNTSYDPDLEYVDGILVERNIGDWLHSLVQSNIIFALRLKYPKIYALPGLRTRTGATRFRLPDVSVLLARPSTRYLLDPPFIAIEILSQDDRMSDVLEKLNEYAAQGTPNIWLIEPRLNRLFTFHGNCLAEAETSSPPPTPRLELTAAEIFAQ